VTVRGAVDRVDVDRAAGTAVVTDYKSGRVQSGWHGSNWAKERTLQVALYMLLVRRALDLQPVGGVYQPLRGDKIGPRGVVLDSLDVAARHPAHDRMTMEEIDTVLDDAEQRALALAERLRRGELVPSPATCAYQGGCAHPGICRGSGA
jgi:RecB family exonuclease